MADLRVTHLNALINRQSASQEALSECLTKAEAMMQVAVNTDFLELSESVTYNYLWVLSDLITKAKKMNDQLLNTLLKEKQINTDN